MKKIHLIFIFVISIVLVVLGLRSGLIGPTSQRIKVQDHSGDLIIIGDTLRSKCYKRALGFLHEHEMANNYCNNFVSHIMEHDILQIFQQYEISGKSVEPMILAMEDTISWKLKSHDEKPHELVDIFIRSLKTHTSQFNSKTEL